MPAPVSRDHARLLAFINRRQRSPHSWGRGANDCVAFILGAVEAQTGTPRPCSHDWNTRAGGLRLIKQYGGLEPALDAHFVKIAPAQAQRGDIAGVPDDQFGVHPMIVEGETLVGPGETGNVRLPRSAMVMAWSATAPLRAKAAQ